MPDQLQNLGGVNYQNTAGQPKGKSELGKDDFLNLMIAQLKFQDPMEPLKGTEFTAQLAQFSSLEQLSNMSKSLDNSISANLQLSQSVNNTMAATLIGKDVKLSGTTLQNTGQENTEFGYTLIEGNASEIEVNVYDAGGNLVKTFDDPPKVKGDNKLLWDFTDNNGNKLEKGSYRFEVTAKSSNGSTLSAEGYRYGAIDSIRYTDNGTALVVNGVEYSLADVYEIINQQSNNSN